MIVACSPWVNYWRVQNYNQIESSLTNLTVRGYGHAPLRSCSMNPGSLPHANMNAYFITCAYVRTWLLFLTFIELYFILNNKYLYYIFYIILKIFEKRRENFCERSSTWFFLFIFYFLQTSVDFVEGKKRGIWWKTCMHFFFL